MHLIIVLIERFLRYYDCYHSQKKKLYNNFIVSNINDLFGLCNVSFIKKCLLTFYIKIAHESKLYFINVILWCLLVQSYQISLHIDLGHAFFFALQHSIQIPINFP